MEIAGASLFRIKPNSIFEMLPIEATKIAKVSTCNRTECRLLVVKIEQQRGRNFSRVNVLRATCAIIKFLCGGGELCFARRKLPF